MDLMTQLQTTDAEFTLKQVQMLMVQIVQWLIRAGVGYTEFSTALKPIFYQQALAELEKLQQKPTDSAVSLLAGLHRKDVSAFKKVQQAGEPLSEAEVAEPINVPARVIGLWVAEQLPESLPFVADNQPSFESLVKRISTEKHPRSILTELERLGIVEERDHQVHFLKGRFIPNVDSQETTKIFTKNVSALLGAGLHNLFEPHQPPYLEQAIFADELTPESITLLHHESVRLWEELSIQVLQLAIARCHADEGQADAVKTFRFGAYQYDE